MGPGFISHTTHECLIKIVSNIIFCQNAHLKFSQKRSGEYALTSQGAERKGGRGVPSTWGHCVCVCVCVSVGFFTLGIFVERERETDRMFVLKFVILPTILIAEAATIRSTLCLADTW